MEQTVHQKSTTHLCAKKKKAIALDALANHRVTQVANRHQVARNTVYVQKDKALAAVNDAFNVNDNDVLFYLPITKAVIAQMIVGLYLICKASYRDIIYWFACHLDFPVSLGHINNVLDEANVNAITLNESYDLSPIKQAASDEIFHQGKPIMATVDIESRYCAGLNKYDQRCGTSWGVELLQLQDQGFAPHYAVIDGAKGLRAGYEEALPSCLLLFDHFHIDKDANDLLRHLKNKRDSLLTTAVKLAVQMERAKQQGQSYKLAAKVGKANSAYEKAEQAYQTIRTLLTWFQFDVLPLAGVAPQERELLYDFILEELKPFLHSDRVNKFYKSMLNQRTHLLKVIYQLDNKLKAIAEKFHIEQSIVWQIAHCARYDMNAPTYHQKSEKFEQAIGAQFDDVENAVLAAIDSLHTTSSMVENYNSRLKPFLDERKGFHRHRLALFQFILNHRPFARSEHQSHKGKTAAELMSGKPHPHWLKMLGFTPFSRTA